MTPDEATLCAGRILEVWPDCRIAFDEWQTAFAPFDDADIRRAIDHLAPETDTRNVTILLVLSAMSARPPAPATAPRETPPLPPATVPYAGPDQHVATLIRRSLTGDQTAILELDGWARMHARKPDKLTARLQARATTGDDTALLVLEWFQDRMNPEPSSGSNTDTSPPATHDTDSAGINNQPATGEENAA